MIKVGCWKTLCPIFLICVATAIAAPAQVYTTLFSFDGTDGIAPPYMSLVQGTDGLFYGTTQRGGAYSNGTVFKISSTGTQTVLYSFCLKGDPCPDGSSPYAGLVQANDGNFYGTTYSGGAFASGTIFRITPSGVLTTLYSFCATGSPCPDGNEPTGALIQGIDGNLYGTTFSGGAGTNCLGTVFQATLDGNLTTLYSFCSQDGGLEPFGGLIQSQDGNFYGTTLSGGGEVGTVFKITATGKLTTLYAFCSQGGKCTDGAYPYGGLVEDASGNFYGTTQRGGWSAIGFCNDGCGTVFKITPGGTFTRLYSFCNTVRRGGCIGGSPVVGLALGSEGYFFGATDTDGQGTNTIFGVTPTGQFENIHKFSPGGPTGGLVQGTDGLLYGTGPSAPGDGVVYSFGVKQGPFVKTSPAFGQVGASIIILGTNLTGATSVTFNGTPAQFTVGSASEITTNVPVGATSGRVKVATASGTLTSNLPFTVTQ